MIKKDSTRFLRVLTIVVLLGLLCGSANAATLLVPGDGSNDGVTNPGVGVNFNLLSGTGSALEAATDGDVIRITDGGTYGGITIPFDLDVTIEGPATINTAGGLGIAAIEIYTWGVAQNVTLTSLTLDGGGSLLYGVFPTGGGYDGATVNINDCLIQNFFYASVGTARFDGASVIDDGACVINATESRFVAGTAGIMSLGDKNVWLNLTDCAFTGSSWGSIIDVWPWDGVSRAGPITATLDNVYFNSTGGGWQISLQGAAAFDITLDPTSILNGGYGVTLGGNSGTFNANGADIQAASYAGLELAPAAGQTITVNMGGGNLTNLDDAADGGGWAVRNVGAGQAVVNMQGGDMTANDPSFPAAWAQSGPLDLDLGGGTLTNNSGISAVRVEAGLTMNLALDGGTIQQNAVGVNAISAVAGSFLDITLGGGTVTTADATGQASALQNDGTTTVTGPGTLTGGIWAVENLNGSLTLRDLTVSGSGGGSAVYMSATRTGDLLIDGCTINAANRSGIEIGNPGDLAWLNNGNLTILDSEIFAATDAGIQGFGGGLWDISLTTVTAGSVGGIKVLAPAGNTVNPQIALTSCTMSGLLNTVIYSDNNSNLNLTATDCEFKNNSVHAIQTDGGTHATTLTRCVLHNNKGYGIAWMGNAGTNTLVLDNTEISSTTSDAIWAQAGNSPNFDIDILNGSVIKDGGGNGFFNYLPTGTLDLNIQDSSIVNNATHAIALAGAGIGIQVNLEGSTFTDNLSVIEEGYVVLNSDTSIVVDNCDIDRHEQLLSLRSNNTDVTIDECDITPSRALLFMASPASTVTLTSSTVDVRGVTTNVWNLLNTESMDHSIEIANTDFLTTGGFAFMQQTSGTVTLNAEHSTWFLAEDTSPGTWFLLSFGEANSSYTFDQCDFVNASGNYAGELTSHWLQDENANGQATAFPGSLTIRDSILYGAAAYADGAVAQAFESHNAIQGGAFLAAFEETGDGWTNDGSSINVGSVRYFDMTWGSQYYLTLGEGSTALGLNSGVGGSETYAGAKGSGPVLAGATDWTLY